MAATKTTTTTEGQTTTTTTVAEIKKAATTDEGSVVFVVQNADCSGISDLGSAPAYKEGSRNFAVYGQLESGTYCLASQ